jgi:hypothetical protein
MISLAALALVGLGASMFLPASPAEEAVDPSTAGEMLVR